MRLTQQKVQRKRNRSAGDVRNAKPGNVTRFERLASTKEQMQVPNGAAPFVQRSKLPLIDNFTRYK